MKILQISSHDLSDIQTLMNSSHTRLLILRRKFHVPFPEQQINYGLSTAMIKQFTNTLAYQSFVLNPKTPDLSSGMTFFFSTLQWPLSKSTFKSCSVPYLTRVIGSAGYSQLYSQDRHQAYRQIKLQNQALQSQQMSKSLPEAMGKMPGRLDLPLPCVHALWRVFIYRITSYHHPQGCSLIQLKRRINTHLLRNYSVLCFLLSI